MDFSTTVNRIGVFLVVLISACAPKVNYKYKALEYECNSAYSEYDKYISELKAEIKLKNERLSKFNQIDGDGKLRDHTWKGDTSKKVTGKESWQK